MANDGAVVSSKLPPKFDSFSLLTVDSYEVTDYTWDEKNWVEVEIFVNGVLPRHAYQVELSPDKLRLIWRRATPKSVSNPLRLQQTMTNYDQNHSRVVAHSDIFQKVLQAELQSESRA